jgi:spore germination protein GerM
MRSKQSAFTVLLAAMLLVAAVGCGSSQDAGVGRVSTSPDSGSDSVNTAPPMEEEKVQLFFIQGEVTEPIVRDATGGAPEALELLMEGPTDEERGAGLASAIPEGARLLGYSVSDGKAVVDFSGELADYGGGSAMVEAITGQITETVKANDPRVTVVEITVEGRPSEEVLQP